MGAARIAILAAAAVAAIALALIVRGMMTGEKQAAAAVAPQEPARPMVQVLVAKSDLALGARISKAEIAWQAWPEDALNPAFITDGKAAAAEADGAVGKAAQSASRVIGGDDKLAAFEGAIVKEPIAKGEPITLRKIVRGGEGGYLSVVLQPGMRAVAIPVSSESGAGGFILPGDRVDVVQSRQAPDGEGFITEVLMQNVRVLAIDQSTEPEKESKTIVGGTVTLEVPASDVGVLARGKAQGEMMLSLRAYTDIGGPIGRGVQARSEMVRVNRGGEVQEMAVR